jgi:hypothetical protein
VYIRAVRASINRLVDQRWLTRDDARWLFREATRVDIR